MAVRELRAKQTEALHKARCEDENLGSRTKSQLVSCKSELLCAQMWEQPTDRAVHLNQVDLNSRHQCPKRAPACPSGAKATRITIRSPYCRLLASDLKAFQETGQQILLQLFPEQRIDLALHQTGPFLMLVAHAYKTCLRIVGILLAFSDL